MSSPNHLRAIGNSLVSGSGSPRTDAYVETGIVADLPLPALELERLRNRHVLFFLDAVSQYVDAQPELRGLPLGADLPEIAKEFGLAPNDAFAAVRMAITGSHDGPPLALLFPLLGHDRIIISAKVSGVQDLLVVYRQLSARCDYPLHLGLTEAGMGSKGIVASSAAMGVLLQQGIGDTIRISLLGDPVPEIQAAFDILQATQRRVRKPELIAWPTCGRLAIDLEAIIARLGKRLGGGTTPVKVSVLGCVVNGPGEAREADVGIARSHAIALEVVGEGVGGVKLQAQRAGVAAHEHVVEAVQHLLAARRSAAGPVHRGGGEAADTQRRVPGGARPAAAAREQHAAVPFADRAEAVADRAAVAAHAGLGARRPRVALERHDLRHAARANREGEEIEARGGGGRAGCGQRAEQDQRRDDPANHALECCYVPGRCPTGRARVHC